MASNQFWLYEIHTPDKMYTIEAAYFTAGKYGVMFFDGDNRGIGFVPNTTLDLLRITKPSKIDLSEVVKWHNVNIKSEAK
jgi:hypothetical protein